MTTPRSPLDTPHRWFVRSAGRAATIAGIWSLVTIPFFDTRLVSTVNLAWGLVGIPVSSHPFGAAVLLILGSALRRGLRAGWLAAILLEVSWLISTGLMVANEAINGTESSGLKPWVFVYLSLASAASLVVTVLLILNQRGFPARLRKGSWLMTLAVFAAGLLASYAAILLLTGPFHGTLHGYQDRAAWSAGAVLGLFGIGLPQPAGQGPAWLGLVGGLLGVLALLIAVVTFLRSARAKQFLTADEELKLRELLERYGEDDSLGYFGTRRDKSAIFSPDGRAAVTFRTVASVSLASADPIGDRESWEGAIEAWLADARAHGWYPAALSASVEGAEAYDAAGLTAVRLGDEAIIQVDAFRLSDPRMRGVRRAVSHCTKAGYTVKVRRHDAISDDELAHLAELADRWRGDEPDRGFSMALNRFGDHADASMVTITAYDHDGTIRGLLSFVPWGRRGLSLDVMRRDPDAANGINEYMVASLIEHCDDLGVRRISLNFAVFRSIFASAEHVGAGPLVKLADGVLGFASRFWQLETLYRSNDKYQPLWVPRYLCFDSTLSLVRVALAAGMAEGFVPSPRPVSQRNSDALICTIGDRRVPLVDAIAEQERCLRTIAPPERKLNAMQKARRLKVERLVAAGQEAWPVKVARDHSLADVRAAHASLGVDAHSGETVSVTGRVRALRDFGGLTFAVLEEDSVRLQAMLSRGPLPAESQLLWRRVVDVGDIVSVTGEVITSHTGELSVLASSWQMASKCLSPMPGLHGGLTDPEARLRQRHLDMIVNTETRDLLEARSRAIAAFRDGFERRGFAEVETPMLHAVHGGASARPFRTHINAYHQDLSLRIAPELYLKRLAVGGMGKIFELNRNFRNEGADATHNPEFTAVEAYQAWADYSDMRELTRAIILEVATAVHGEPVAVRPDTEGNPQRVRLDVDWPVISVHEAVSRAAGVALTSASSIDEVLQVCRHHGVATKPGLSSGELVLELYDALVEPATTLPVFYTDFPIETSPLTRTHRSDPRLSERWDLVAFGAELGTAYSELVDPIDQRNRLTAQSMKAAAGDLEAMEIDEQFLSAMEYAMPPTGGLGIGVDRVIMLLCGVNIRSTLAFPFVRA